MKNKLQGPAIPVKDAKQPNIPHALDMEKLIPLNISALAAAMASPVRGSTPSPFADARFYSYTSSNGQEYKFTLTKVNNAYLQTIYYVNSNGSLNMISLDLYKTLPDDLKNYMVRFEKNIAFT